jgi:hypothetical protein
LGLVLLSGQRLILGLLATTTLEVVPFRAFTSPPAPLPFFKCFLEVVFYEGVQHCLLSHLSCVKMAAFQFYFQSGKQRIVGWMVTTVMLRLVKNVLVKKEV